MCTKLIQKTGLTWFSSWPVRDMWGHKAKHLRGISWRQKESMGDNVQPIMWFFRVCPKTGDVPKRQGWSKNNDKPCDHQSHSSGNISQKHGDSILRMACVYWLSEIVKKCNVHKNLVFLILLAGTLLVSGAESHGRLYTKEVHFGRPLQHFRHVFLPRLCVGFVFRLEVGTKCS
jgi:hypothetical protein